LLAAAFAQTEKTSWELRVCANEDNLPYSNRLQQGFENRVAEILADELKAKLVYVWLPQPHHPEYEVILLRGGNCDLFMGVLDGRDAFITTEAYYRSTYVFVSREDASYDVHSLDDPLLHRLRLGVVRASPPDLALTNRGIVENVLHYFAKDPFSAITDAVAAEKIDLGIVWGPIAGYYSKQQLIPLTLTHVTPEVDMPFLPMVLSMSMGVREQDEALRDLLNRALVIRWKEIQAILNDYGVPLLQLSPPAISIGSP